MEKTYAAKQQLTIKMHWVKCNQESDGKMPQVYFVWRHFFSFSFWLLDTVGNVKGVWLSPNADTSFSFLNFFPIIIISFFRFFVLNWKTWSCSLLKTTCFPCYRLFGLPPHACKWQTMTKRENIDFSSFFRKFSMLTFFLFFLFLVYFPSVLFLLVIINCWRRCIWFFCT